MWKRNYKGLVIGLVVGLIGPVIGAILYYLLKLRQVNFQHFVELAVTELNFAVPLLSFGAIVNLGFFYLFLQMSAPTAARGVILATLLYAFFVIIAKFLL